MLLATAVALVFLLLPIAAIFLRVPPGDLLDALGTEAARNALIVTLETNVVSMVLIVLFGTPTAYWVATRRRASVTSSSRSSSCRSCSRPPSPGIGLLAAFGRLGLLGGTFDALGIDIAFTKVAVVLAVTFVASPFYVRTAIAPSRRSTRPCLRRRGRSARARAASSSGSPSRSPPAGSGPGPHSRSRAGSASSAPRSCSPAPSKGVTQTLSLAIYEQFDVDFDVALAISGLLVIISATTLLLVKVFTRWRSTSTSPIPFAASTPPSR